MPGACATGKGMLDKRTSGDTEGAGIWGDSLGAISHKLSQGACTGESSTVSLVPPVSLLVGFPEYAAKTSEPLISNPNAGTRLIRQGAFGRGPTPSQKKLTPGYWKMRRPISSGWTLKFSSVGRKKMLPVCKELVKEIDQAPCNGAKCRLVQ